MILKRILFLLSAVIVLFIINSIALAGTIQLPQTGQTTCYDELGNVIDCAGTGQDGEIRAGVPWPEPRFTITYCDANGPCANQGLDCDGDASTDVITDNLTGLMLARNGNLPNGTRTWYEALDYANNLTLCGYSDWRLPNVNELESLVNAEEPNQAIWLNNEGFINVNQSLSEYISSTTYDYQNNCAWEVWMHLGIWWPLGPKDYSVYYVWPVRGGQLNNPDSNFPSNIWKTGQKTTYALGDDGNTQAGVTWPDPRFRDHGDGTITDNLTGLMWLQDANCFGTRTWQNALDIIADFNNNPGSYNCQNCTATYSDWRLPNKEELRSLVNYGSLTSSWLYSQGFRNVDAFFWSSTTHSSYTDSAWFVNMSSGDGFFRNKSDDYYLNVWPVRGGQVPNITTPLHDEDGLHMTTRDYSNFATLEYFNVLNINHSGVDLALSQDGTRTASQETAGKTAYSICDGEVDFIHRSGGLYSFIKIHHPNCNGQNVIAYYGHIAPNKGLTTVKKDDPIGTVKDWGGNSHLHLTIDTQTERDLSRINYVVCDYTLDSNTQTVISLSNCSDDTRKLTKNKMLLKMGWGQVKTLSYKNSDGRLYRKSLYISENAMRQLGFISFFDLYQE